MLLFFCAYGDQSAIANVTETTVELTLLEHFVVILLRSCKTSDAHKIVFPRENKYNYSVDNYWLALIMTSNLFTCLFHH